MPKYIFITGGVLSSLGKGLTAAAIGAILESMGYRVSFLKLDPYLNVDPGTMSPYQHGEVFVTNDGAETDLDIGHYERFTHATLKKEHSVTSGKLYARLIEKERKGDFLGGTIQIVPHLTDEIKKTIQHAALDVDCTIVEIGGTVGDIEGLPFIEAIRQMGLHAGRKDCLYIHLTYVPYLTLAQELKTKPTQHAVKQLNSLGVQPDILICRSEVILPNDVKDKIALFTNVETASVVSAPDLASIYELPLHFVKEQLPQTITRYLNIPYCVPALEAWENIAHTLQTLLENSVNVAIVGKYMGLKDAYKSLYEALVHAQIPTRTKINTVWIDSEELTPQTVSAKLQTIDAIIIPGGFGDRGIPGKILAVQYARENNIPFLGICLGMQIAAIEFARNVLKIADADSTEFTPATKSPIIDFMAAQKDITHKGGTMRLGAQICALKPHSLAAKVYQQNSISERHRHRYEFNTHYAKQFEQAGFIISGKHETSDLPEIIEIPEHPYFIACQFHPELQSKPFAPHPLFVKLIEKARQIDK
jgi:CTP synthase